MLTPDRYAAAIVAEAAAFTDTIHGADLELRVPTCPEWTLRDLVHHLGRAYYWSGQIVATRATEFVPFEEVVDGKMPPDGHAEWLRAGAAKLVDAVADIGPDNDVWTWSDDHRAVFWLRRILHEGIVHRADAAFTVVRDYTVPVDLAVDGVDEWLGILTSKAARARSGAVAGTGQTLHFHATDGGEWLIRRDPDGPTLLNEHVKGDVTVRAPATDLLLVLYGRIPTSEVEVFGDPDLLTHWRDHTKF